MGLVRRPLQGSLAALAVLVLFHAFQLASWNRLDTRPPAWDQSIQLEIAHDTMRALEDGDYKRLLLMRPKPGMPPFPPLHHLLIQYSMDDQNPAASARWINIFYLALLCFSAWGLGRHFAGDWAGLAAAILISCIPEVQTLMREQLLDLGLTAWVAASYWALTRSERFERLGVSVLFGALFAAAMLTKWSAFTYYLPVLWVAGKSYKDKRRRWNMLACAASAAVLIAPWYLAQWPVVLPRLVEASSDQARAFWKDGAFLSYVWQMIDGMDLPFALLSLVSLAVPAVRRRKEDAWVLIAWFLSAFVFWTLVPNRQLRYLLPALVPLAVLVTGPFPKQVLIGLCAFQLFSAANFPRAWVPHVQFSVFIPVSIFRSQPPAKEDWKIGGILKTAAELHDDSMPFGNMTLLANHPSFNGATFNWEADRLGIEDIKMRGVNRRVCEFSEFMLIKTGSLGPPSVVNQLPQVRREILREGSWFRRGYAEVRRWPLPDATEAVLYRRRRQTSPPLGTGRLHLARFEMRKFSARDLTVELGRWDAGRGSYPRVVLSAGEISLRGLKVEHPEVVMEDLVAAVPEGRGRRSAERLLRDVRLLGASRISFESGTVTEAAAAEFFRERVKGTRSVRFRLDETASIQAKAHGLPLGAEVSAETSKDSLTIGIERLSLAGLPLPVFLLGPHARYTLDFAPDPELPFRLDISGLRIAGGRLELGAAG